MSSRICAYSQAGTKGQGDYTLTTKNDYAPRPPGRSLALEE